METGIEPANKKRRSISGEWQIDRYRYPDTAIGTRICSVEAG
jgi:hypothetical protein